MGVYIRDMTIEEFAEYGGEYAGYLIGTGQAEGISDHGALIDRDALNATDSWEWIRHDAPVVIPAERSEE